MNPSATRFSLSVLRVVLALVLSRADQPIFELNRHLFPLQYHGTPVGEPDSCILLARFSRTCRLALVTRRASSHIVHRYESLVAFPIHCDPSRLQQTRYMKYRIFLLWYVE